MKRKLLFLVIMILPGCFNVFSQENTGEASHYQRVKGLSDSTYLVQQFDRDSIMLFIGTLSSLDPRVRNGRFRFYNKDGKIEVVGFYYQDIPYGKWIYYDEDGKITRVLDYKAPLDFLVASMEENNDESVENLSGPSPVTAGNNENNETNEDETYFVVGPMPTFRGGDPRTIVNYIKENAVYPVYARDMGITDSTVISFKVNGNGEISNASVVSGGSPDLNMEAVRVLLESTGWDPVIAGNGEPVEIYYTIKVVL